MNWEAIGAIGELLSAVAVLATLIYLAVQVRHSRELLERNDRFSIGQTYQARLDVRQDLHRQMAEGDLAEISAKVGPPSQPLETSIKNFESLSRVEQIRYSNYQMRFMLLYDNNLNMLKLGLIDQENIQMGLDNVLTQMPFWKAMNLQIMPTIEAWYEENKE